MRPPWSHKILSAKRRLKEGALKPLKVELTENGFLLRDGYARYLACKQEGLTNFQADLWTEEDEQAAELKALVLDQRT